MGLLEGGEGVDEGGKKVGGGEGEGVGEFKDGVGDVFEQSGLEFFFVFVGGRVG